ncbi:MAG: HPr(Ser) kinase/phosphatase [Ruminococcus sp.]|nr:HPr(Ser) kinase/phosphatase [Ruminococcus sp.]
MSTVYSVTLEKIMKDLSLTPMYMPDEPSNILISNNNISRPGLQLTGYFDFFDKTRILVFGNTEFTFLSRFGAEQQQHVINSIFRFGPPAVILCRSHELNDAMMSSAKENNIPILQSTDTTSSLTASLVTMLSRELAPRITRHGVLVEVYGEGCLIIGDSGVGKSETAIELMKRGHRLIADDAVEIRKTDSRTLIGTSPQNIRHFVELRGVGIINARNLFGMGSIKLSEKIDMVINLELWDGKKAYDRMGLENEYMEILGIDVPIMTIPVKPGRNLSNIIEVAAMNNRQKKMGYNAAQDLLTSLGMVIDEELVEKRVIDNWDK